MQTIFALAIVLVSTSALTVFGSLLIAGAVRRPRSGGETPLATTGGDAAFLFDGPTLIDTNPRGAALLDSLRRAEGRGSDEWNRLTQYLAHDFAGLSATLADLPLTRRARLVAAGDRHMELTLDWLDGAMRLTLVDTLAEDGTVVIDRLSYRALQDELALLRQFTEAAPLLMWREDAQAQVTWANGAYLKRVADIGHGETMTWPLPALFEPGDEGVARRVSLESHGGASQSWFDVTRGSGLAGQGVLSFALPADDAHQAERTKRDFIQTLTKTFATLPTGLAVFDRTRRLQMFNPALTDLTGLETEFLLSRPGIEGFLNRMRDKRVLPEPRDYRSWARRLLEIETSAPAGEFEETWTLPTGQTFRVSANPHPDGALAFLIEDITSETHLTRNTRAEMETMQSVLNQLDDAIAVFAPNGELVLTNTAFSQLWTLEGEDSLGAVTLPEALANWREAGDDAALWTRIAALGRVGAAEAVPVCGAMRLADGERLRVEARRTATGALMIAFATLDPPAETTPRAQVLRASA
ncbi:MAG: PAS-domain containing protein [Rhodobacteraceae bacterium]|nr:PAS-domain containing protein [Paracoccaceae bacterium]